ncbi:MAG: carbamoyltransferase N-terminal domain-containing protein, partial [Burkholderiales bacterium]
MRILGTNFFGHDSALCLLDTRRREVVAESTERSTRICNDWIDVGPTLRAAGIRDLDAACHGYHTLNSQDDEITTPLSLRNLELQKLARAVLRPRYEADLNLSRLRKAGRLAAAFGRSPGAVLRYLRERVLYAARRERPVAAEEMLRYMGKTLAFAGASCASVSLHDHHLCHAASAYYFSPFAFREKALVLSLDGAGDGHFSKLHLFDGPTWTLLGASRSPLLRRHGEATFVSIGAIYSGFTAALAHYGVENEGGLSALAAYGSPDDGLYRALRDCIAVSAQGFAFDLSRAKTFFDDAALAARALRLGERNFAATVQRWLEDVVVEHLAAAHALHGTDNLCLAGGVAANIVMNMRIFERTPFRAIHVFP